MNNLLSDEAIFAKFLEQRFEYHNQDMIKTLLAIDKSMTKMRYNHYDVFKAYKKLSSQQKNHVIAEILLPF
jgi:lipopolysaccharide biosynthesis glycosyltransferase